MAKRRAKQLAVDSAARPFRGLDVFVVEFRQLIRCGEIGELMEKLQSFNLVCLTTLPLLGSNHDGEIAFNLRWPVSVEMSYKCRQCG